MLPCHLKHTLNYIKNRQKHLKNHDFCSRQTNSFYLVTVKLSYNEQQQKTFWCQTIKNQLKI